ncbi:MAG TPA: DUF4118 domain-containing protein [Nitrospira sp.]|nr:DUF4118 domain-containing protein [Nitrospira sp.]
MPSSDEWPWKPEEARAVVRYALPLVTTVLALQINWFIAPFLSLLPPFLTFLAAIMVTAWYGGFSSAVFGTLISVLVIDFYFIPPLYSLNVKPGDLAALAFFAVEALMMAYCITYLQTSRGCALNREKQLRRLQELSGRLVEGKTLDSMLDEVIKASVELLGADKGVIFLYESREHALRLIKQIGFKAEFSAQFDRVPIGAFSWGTAFERKHRVIIENVYADQDFAHLAPLYHEFGVVAAQSTPLFNPDGRVFGILSSYWSRPYRPSISDLQLLDLYAHQAERILLYERNEELLHQANEELERAVTRKQVLLMERDVKLTKLMSDILLTEERERRELSSELHDSLGQLLAFAKVKLHLARRSSAEKAESYIKETEQVLDRSLQYTRSLMAEFDPPRFDQLGLPGALLWLKDRMQQHDLLVTMHMESKSVVLPHDHVVLLYKCIRELLMNVVKHANVNKATVTMKMAADSTLELTVKDDGVGFRPMLNVRQPPTGYNFGLRKVRERIEDLGGRFHIESKLGQGCTVTLALPIAVSGQLQQNRAAYTAQQDRVAQESEANPNQQALPLL